MSACILAGGAGRRMGGQDKGLIELAGRPLVAHVIERLKPQVTDIVISANRNQAAYARFGFPVFVDTIGNGWGPLAGIYTALATAQSNMLLVVPCDMPLLPAMLAARLFARKADERVAVAIAHDGSRLQNTCCLIDADRKPHLADYLNSGGRKAETWLSSQPHVVCDFSDQTEAFRNVNTPDDLRELEAALATGQTK